MRVSQALEAGTVRGLFISDFGTINFKVRRLEPGRGPWICKYADVFPAPCCDAVQQEKIHVALRRLRSAQACIFSSRDVVHVPPEVPSVHTE